MTVTRLFLGIFLVVIFLSSLSSAAHFITGYVEDALDGTSPNGKTVQLFNPFNSESLTSIIGSSGPSGADNIYLIDCELLPSSCSIGTPLTMSVLDDSDSYVSLFDVEVNVTGAGFDLADNLSLNSPPNATNSYPASLGFVSSLIDFNCSTTDLDGNLYNISLYGNWSGGWHLNETADITGSFNYSIFTKTLDEGTYLYSCVSWDSLGIRPLTNSNYTFTIDTIPPVISEVNFSTPAVCGNTTTITINCSATDAHSGIAHVTLSSNGTNFSTTFISGSTYSANITLDRYGNWSFTCYAEDFAGNKASLFGGNVTVKPDTAELEVLDILFSNPSPIEAEGFTIFSNITNNGCSVADSLRIGLFTGDPDSGGINLENTTISLDNTTIFTINFTQSGEIGSRNFFIEADSNHSFSEVSETNNKENLTMVVGAWQEFYGNVSIDKILAQSSLRNISSWLNETSLGGNIFITDRDSDISWNTLQALGKNTTGQNSSNDFTELDAVLLMSSLNDSVSNTFTSHELANFTVHQIQLVDVPIINSTSNSPFKTGIIWDTSDDSNGEYDSAEEEDIIFLVEMIESGLGAYGKYDYEIQIPARMRNYTGPDTSDVYLYFDLN